MGRAELPAQIGQGKERGLQHGLHNNPSMIPRPLTNISQPIRKPRLRLVTSWGDDGPPAPFRSCSESFGSERESEGLSTTSVSPAARSTTAPPRRNSVSPRRDHPGN